MSKIRLLKSLKISNVLLNLRPQLQPAHAGDSVGMVAIPIIRYVIDSETFKLSSVSVRAYVRYFMVWVMLLIAGTLALADNAIYASGISGR